MMPLKPLKTAKIMSKEYFELLDSEEIVIDLMKYVAGELYDQNMEKGINKVYRKIAKDKYNKRW